MKRKHMAIALLATVFTACSNQEDILQEQDTLKGVPMVVTTNLNEQVVSRAGITGDNLTGHTFLFSSTPVGEEEGSSYIYTDLVAKYDNGKWSFSKNGESIVPVWKDQATKIQVTALRAAAPSNDVYSLVTTPNETTDIQANDWLYFSGTINPTLSGDANNELALKNGTIPINFKHINSKIDIKLSFAQSVGELTIASVKIDGTKTSATLNNGVPTVTTDRQATAISACSVVELTHNYEVILLPQTANLEVEVRATDDNNNTYVFYWASSNEVELESGKKYTLELTLDYNEVNGLLASRGAWVNGGDSQSLNAK